MSAANRLTAREREVLRLYGKGLGAREIGSRLGISPNTARKHRDNAVRRTKSGSQVSAILELDRAERTNASA